MEDPKWFIKSKTLLGVVLSILPALLPAIGVSFSVDDSQLVSGSVDGILQGIGALLAIYGRFVAKSPVTAAP